MSKMGRFAQEEQEREKARAASIYEAEIDSLVEEIRKLSKRLDVIESSDLIMKGGKIYSDFKKDNTTVSRPKEVEEYIPWSGYVVVNEDGNSVDSSISKEKLRTSPAYNKKYDRIIKVKEVYEANGDV